MEYLPLCIKDIAEVVEGSCVTVIYQTSKYFCANYFAKLLR